MNTNNKPPFHVGQRVVRIKKNKKIPKGTIVTVHKCYKCDKCGDWKIAVKEYLSGNDSKFRMCECGANNYHLCPNPHLSGAAKYFAPISPCHQDVEIAEELLKEPVPETLDKLKPILS